MSQMQSSGSNETTALLEAIAGLITSGFDYVEVTATDANGNPTTIVYKTGGAGGATVNTLTITYDANESVQTITSV